MKNTIVITVVLVLSLCATRADAQGTSFKQAFISAGAAFPAAPDQFYDYWKTGWSLAGGLEYALAPQLRLDISGTYSRFGFDEGRFFKRL